MRRELLLIAEMIEAGSEEVTEGEELDAG